ncbi:MAG: hypothetical protein WAT81_03400, partial [Candidatus Moraniibacteriota bacterium]
KDTLDLIGIGSLPAIGTAVTLCFSFLIFMLLFTFDRSGARGSKRVAQGMVMVFFTLIEGVGFIINILPLETLTIVFLYIISYRSWKEAQKATAASNNTLTKKQKVQQAQMARAVARQAQIAAQVDVSPEATSPQGRATPASRMSGFSGGSGLIQQPGTAAPDLHSAANDAMTREVGAARSAALPPRMMDGARVQPAQVRGRAANGSVYRGAQPARQQAVSGSDIASTRRLQSVGAPSSAEHPARISAVASSAMGAGSPTLIPMAQAPRSAASAASSAGIRQGVSRSGTRSSLVPSTLQYQSVVSKPDDAEARIREAGSRLSQLGRSPKGVAAATGTMMALAAPLHQSPDTEVGDYPAQNIGRTKVGLHPSSTNRSISERNTQTVSITLPGTEQSHLERALPQDFSMAAEQPRIDFQKLLPKVVPEFEHILAQIGKADSKPFVPSYEGQVRPKNLNKMMLEILGFSEEEIGKLVSAGKEGHLQEDLDRMLHQEETDTRALLANPKFKETLNRCESALSKMVEKAGVTSYAEIAPKALHLGKLGLALAEQNMSGKLQMHYLGRYLPAANSILVLHPEGNDPDKAVHIRVHETLHALSYNPERSTREFEDITESDDMKVSGVTRDSKKLGMILNPLNEGITEYFAQKISKQAGIKNPDVGDYQNYVSSVNALIERVSRVTNKNKEAVEDEIFSAYSKKTGVLHIGKILERYVGPGSLRLMQMIPGKFSAFVKALEQYELGVTDARFSLHVSTLDNSGTTAQKIIQQYPFIQFTKDKYAEGDDGMLHFEEEVVYSREVIEDNAVGKTLAAS